MKNLRFTALFSLFFFFCLWVHADLIKYVQKPESVYGWKKGRKVSAQLTEFQLTSQTWQKIKWQHRLFLFMPSSGIKKEQNTALVMVSGSGKVKRYQKFLQNVADKTQAPVFLLLDVPNQPLFGNLWEDALLSYTIEKAMEKQEAEWAILLPMVKSVVKAMDAAQEIAAAEGLGSISQFVVSGASKRGWTSWLSAAVDSRVQAIVPIVYDNLNLSAQMENQLARWGKYSPSISDYSEKNLPDALKTERGQWVEEIIDPYAYRQNITVPKIIVNGTNDPYWPLNAARFYYDELPGEKRLLYIPNDAHAIKKLDRLSKALIAIVKSCSSQTPLPSFSCQFSKRGNQVNIAMDVPESENIYIWKSQAGSLDFRDAHWNSSKIPSGFSSVSFPLRGEKYQAFFVEVEFSYLSYPLRLSSEIFFTEIE